MLEMKCKYWYKDNFIKLSDNMTHEAYIKKYFNELFPNEKSVGNNRRVMDFALDNAYVRILTLENELVCLYGKSFKKHEQFYNDVVENLNPRIKKVTIERIDCEQNFFISMSVEEFLNKDFTCIKDDTINYNKNNFNIGDLVRYKTDNLTDELIGFSLKKDDVGIIFEQGMSDIRTGSSKYSVYWKSKGKLWWIDYEDLELVKKFEWPE